MHAVTPLDTRYRADALIDVAVPAGFTIILAWLSAQEVSITQGEFLQEQEPAATSVSESTLPHTTPHPLPAT